MAQRLALIPEELVSPHHLRNPEIRIENDIIHLLDREALPDDMKVKLLSQLMMRYHKSVHAPREPVRVTITDDEKKSPSKSLDVKNPIEEQDSTEDEILKDIFTSSPKQYWKYIPQIVSKLQTRAYSWNNSGEMIANNKVIKNSRIADFFSFLFRNAKTQKEPQHFDTFLRALSEINIPQFWIGNKRVLERIKKFTPLFPLPSSHSTPAKGESYNDSDDDDENDMSRYDDITKWTPL